MDDDQETYPGEELGVTGVLLCQVCEWGVPATDEAHMQRGAKRLMTLHFALRHPAILAQTAPVKNIESLVARTIAAFEADGISREEAIEWATEQLIVRESVTG